MSAPDIDVNYMSINPNDPFGTGVEERKLRLNLGLDFETDFLLDMELGQFEAPQESTIITPSSSHTLTKSASSTSLSATTRPLSHCSSLPSLTSSSPAIKSVLLARNDVVVSSSPSQNVKFALPPNVGNRLPRLPAAPQGSRPKRRVQVGAFGELSWVTEPVRHTQVEGRNASQGRPAPSKGRAMSAIRDDGSLHRRSTFGTLNREDDSKDWLIAHHVQQLHAREHDRQKKELERAKRTPVSSPLSPLSREPRRSSLPSITEEAACPPRSTSLRAMQTATWSSPQHPGWSQSPTALDCAGVDSTPSAVPRTMPAHAHGYSHPRSCIPEAFMAASAPTSPLAQRPVTRAPVPPPPTAPRHMPDASPDVPVSRLRRHTSLLNLTLRRATKPLKLDFTFGKHARSNSQSSKTSMGSEVSEMSEVSVDTIDTDSKRDMTATPSTSESPSTSLSSLVSAGSDVASARSFQTCTTSLSAATLALRISSPAPSSFEDPQPQTPRSPSEGSATPTSSYSPTVPGTPESDVLATPGSPLYARPWLEKGEEKRVENVRPATTVAC